MWALSRLNVAGEAEALNFSFYLTLNSQVWLVAILLNGAALDCSLNEPKESHGGFSPPLLAALG